MLYGMIGVTFVYNFALRKFDFRWTSKKTQGWTALKNGGSSLAVGNCLQTRQKKKKYHFADDAFTYDSHRNC